MKNIYSKILTITLLTVIMITANATDIQRSGEVIYKQNEGLLTIPKVLIGPDYFTVKMQHKGEGLDFTVTDYEKIEPKPTVEILGSRAHVESIELLQLESFPVQIHVSVKGYLINGCEQIDKVYSEKTGNIFKLTITTKSIGENCTMALVPFQKGIPLDVYGLKAGNYTVLVNDVKGSFELGLDNIIE